MSRRRKSSSRKSSSEGGSRENSSGEQGTGEAGPSLQRNGGQRRAVRRSSRRAERQRRGVWFFVILCIIALPIAGMIYLVTTKKNSPLDLASSLGSKSKTEILSIEKALGSSDPESVMKYAQQIREIDFTKSIPERVVDLRQRLRVSDKLKSMDLSSEQRSFARLYELDTLTMLDLLNTLEGLGETRFRNRLVPLAEEYQDDDDEEVRRTARYSILFLLAQEQGDSSNEQKISELDAELLKFLQAFPDNVEAAINVERLIEFVEKLNKRGAANSLLKTASEQLLLGSDPVVRKIGYRLQSRLLFADTNFGQLKERIAMGEPLAIEEAKTLLNRVMKQDTVGRTVCTLMGGIVEAMACDPSRAREAGNAAKWMRGQIEGFSDEREKKLSLKSLDDLEQRISMIGKTVNLDARKFDGSPIASGDFKDKVVVLFFWGTKPRQGAVELAQLKNMEVLSNQNVEVIAVTLTPNENRAVEAMQVILPDAVFISPGVENQILDQFPVSLVPFTVILDKQHKVVRLNPPIGQLQEEVRKLMQ